MSGSFVHRPAEVFRHERQVGEFFERHGREQRMLQRIVFLPAIFILQVIEEKLQYGHGMPPEISPHRCNHKGIGRPGGGRFQFHAAIIAPVLALFN
ncbi:hypothetical protein RHSP_82934 [Rhizobium freirei PRF 81]|uniref:Uncharacterized protein n=1 Tax=Rhizobium freirei PRF 81 TaxID=363754 RepID=N6UWU6_9HYPH|nr:hypothetical protein RHSP_82934 [Rhizobium freirei PRF 81]